MEDDSNSSNRSSFFTDSLDNMIEEAINSVKLKNKIPPDKWNELQPTIDSSINSSLRESAHLLVLTMRSNQDSLLLQRKNDQNEFNKYILEYWKKPLNLLESFIHASIEIGDDLNGKNRRSDNQKMKHSIELLTRLHGRSCQVSQEILTLLNHGFPDGAFARWRTLHEISVVIQIIGSYGEEIAQRYIDYEICQSASAMLEHNKHADKLGREKISDTDIDRIISLKKEKLTTYDPLFSKTNGWASEIIRDKKPKAERFSFSDLEQLVDQDFMRPYYRMASYSVHADIKGIYRQLSGDKDRVIPAGSSIFGFAEPGQNTAISLLKINCVLLSLEKTMQSQLVSMTFEEMCDEICQSFVQSKKT